MLLLLPPTRLRFCLCVSVYLSVSRINLKTKVVNGSRATADKILLANRIGILIRKCLREFLPYGDFTNLQLTQEVEEELLRDVFRGGISPWQHAAPFLALIHITIRIYGGIFFTQACVLQMCVQRCIVIAILLLYSPSNGRKKRT